MTNASAQITAPIETAAAQPRLQPLELLPPPSIHQSSNPSIQSAKPRSRNGKIARLPYLERDMVNRMLRDSLPYDKIRHALEEHGIRVTNRNISNWKTRGGYQQWRAEQDRALENHLLQDNLREHLRRDDATDLPEISLQLAATNLSQFFLRPETQQQLATDPEKLARTISTVCRLSRHLHTLQKYRDEAAKDLSRNPARIKRQDEQEIEMTREIYSAARLGERPGDRLTPGRNYIPKSGYVPRDPSD